MNMKKRQIESQHLGWNRVLPGGQQEEPQRYVRHIRPHPRLPARQQRHPLRHLQSKPRGNDGKYRYILQSLRIGRYQLLRRTLHLSAPPSSPQILLPRISTPNSHLDLRTVPGLLRGRFRRGWSLGHKLPVSEHRQSADKLAKPKLHDSRDSKSHPQTEQQAEQPPATEVDVAEFHLQTLNPQDKISASHQQPPRDCLKLLPLQLRVELQSPQPWRPLPLHHRQLLRGQQSTLLSPPLQLQSGPR